MKTTFKRLAAWMLALLMLLSCASALGEDSVTDYSAGLNLGDVVYADVSDSDKISYTTSGGYGPGGQTRNWTVPIYFYTEDYTVVASGSYTYSASRNNSGTLSLAQSDMEKYLTDDSYAVTGAGQLAQSASGTKYSANSITVSSNGISQSGASIYYFNYSYNSYAVYVPVELNKIDYPVTVTYNVNGGTAAEGFETTKTVNNETENPVTLPDVDEVTRSGYVLTGWSDGTNTYAPGASYTAKSDVTLTAQWTRTSEYTLYCYLLVDGKDPDDFSDLTGTWYGLGDGTIKAAYSPTQYNSQGVGDVYGSDDRGNDDIVAAINAGIITLPSDARPDVTIDGKTYKYADPGSEESYLEGYYTIYWMRVPVSQGANAQPPTSYYGGLCFHLDGRALLNKTSKFKVNFYTKEPGSDDWTQEDDSWSYRVEDGTSESSLTKPEVGDTKTVDGKVYEFDGWYTDEDCTEKATFNGTVDGNRNYYGKWVPKTVDYTTKRILLDEDGNIVDTITEGGNGQIGETVEADITDITDYEYVEGYENGDEKEKKTTTLTENPEDNELKVYYKRKTTPITINKVWNDNNAVDNRPASIDMTLTGSDNSSRTVTLTAAENWTKTVTVPKTKGGVDIVYTASEPKVEGYVLEKTESENGVITLTNKPDSYNVTIKKVVAGSVGDKTTEFTFTYSDDKGTDYSAYDTTLADGESVTLSVPGGATLTVTEGATNGYVTIYRVDEGTAVSASTATVTVSGDTTITFTNTRDVVPDTGVVLDSLPYIVILAVVIVAVVIMLRRRAKNDD